MPYEMTSAPEVTPPSQTDYVMSLLDRLGFKDRRSQGNERRNQDRRSSADDRRSSDYAYQALAVASGDVLQRVDGQAPKDDRRRHFGAAYLLPRRLRGERRQVEDRRASRLPLASTGS